MNIVYAQFDTTVSFGAGAITAPTDVEVGILPFPTSVEGLFLIATGNAFRSRYRWHFGHWAQYWGICRGRARQRCDNGDNNQTLLYSYTTTATNSPIVTGNTTALNTGFTPFALGPVYVGNSPSGVGTITFDY